MGETATVALAVPLGRRCLIYGGNPLFFVFIPPHFLTIHLFACTPFPSIETIRPCDALNGHHFVVR